MKFGHEYQKALANEGFPEQWRGSAIDYKYLKKCIKKVHHEMEDLGLDANTIHHLSEPLDDTMKARPIVRLDGFYSAAQPHLDTIVEEFTPQLRILVDAKTGTPLDATLTSETKQSLRKLARHERIFAGRQAHLGRHAVHEIHGNAHDSSDGRKSPLTTETSDAKWIEVPLSSARSFFDLLAPKLDQLEELREAETRKLEADVLNLGDAVEDVVEPVREGFEAKRDVSYRDLYFWREMFRLYVENPVFYSPTEQNRGGFTYADARKRLESYDQKLRATGLYAKLKTPQAKRAAKQFFDLNVDILKIMHFQEMNAQAMRKILKKFDKRTHLEGKLFLKTLQTKYPALLPPSNRSAVGGAAGFANSIARDMHAELSSKVLSIVPQLDDWNCPVCMDMAWRPVNLGCCQSHFCIRCVIKMQDDGMVRCPTCNAETVVMANGTNIDFEAMDFLEKYFPMEVKRRQRDNEKASLERQYGEAFTKPGCLVM
ncbi:hypothetical protein BAUCODRAFT_21852 [Baudoinia panamericana UAMH 10762]|uniref:RING-type domain-containing protein n=1 Tax=Baudoinia panamericana (strain UAMH 10762) TaxID=717646 RepID=M2NL59_BAUPA|nr:uncharacterized protein BAUCODRAFT_21852 [Baudoinia panamericana UAMH 10762]EMD00210.1 hypothetical protein BAUCODRAFT_21852 [Baudoinia panamericana UAMH 10762]